MISHIGARRVQSVTCNVAGRDIASFVAAVRQRISHMALPSGMYIEFSGTAEEQARSQHDLLFWQRNLPERQVEMRFSRGQSGLRAGSIRLADFLPIRH
jgi:hypothetical protein